MRQRLWGVALAAAAMAGCDGNSVPGTATVLTIDRTCTYVAEDAAHTETAPGKMRIVGRETMHVSYASPVDGSTLYGDLHLTGRDDQFYTINSGDKIAIRINKDDPSRIRRA